MIPAKMVHSFLLLSLASGNRVQVVVDDQRVQLTNPNGDPIQDAFDSNSILNKAITLNMFAITGGRANKGGIQQELCYRMDNSMPKENAFDLGSGVLAYFAKPGAEQPEASKPKRNLPDMSAGYVKAKKISGEDFGINALDGYLDLKLKATATKKPSGQPIVEIASGNAKIYGTGEDAVHCYVRFIHNHDISYGRMANIPTKIQVVGTTDVTWITKQMSADEFFRTAPLCGICAVIKPNWSNTGGTASLFGGTGVCPTGAETNDDFRR